MRTRFSFLIYLKMRPANAVGGLSEINSTETTIKIFVVHKNFNILFSKNILTKL